MLLWKYLFLCGAPRVEPTGFLPLYFLRSKVLHLSIFFSLHHHPHHHHHHSSRHRHSNISITSTISSTSLFEASQQKVRCCAGRSKPVTTCRRAVWESPHRPAARTGRGAYFGWSGRDSLVAACCGGVACEGDGRSDFFLRWLVPCVSLQLLTIVFCIHSSQVHLFSLSLSSFITSSSYKRFETKTQ